MHRWNRRVVKAWAVSATKAILGGQFFIGALVYTTPWYLDTLEAVRGAGVARDPATMGGPFTAAVITITGIILAHYGILATYPFFRSVLPRKLLWRAVAFGSGAWFVVDVSRLWWGFTTFRIPPDLLYVDALNSYIVKVATAFFFIYLFEADLEKLATLDSPDESSLAPHLSEDHSTI